MEAEREVPLLNELLHIRSLEQCPAYCEHAWHTVGPPETSASFLTLQALSGCGHVWSAAFLWCPVTGSQPLP